MAKRGRPSKNKISEQKAALGVTKKMPEPPIGMNKRAKEIWVKVFESVPEEHFCEAEYSMIREYCNASSLCEELQAKLDSGEIDHFLEEDGKVKMHPVHKILTSNRSVIAQFAMRMKITASSRIDRRSAQKGFREMIGKDDEREGLMWGE